MKRLLQIISLIAGCILVSLSIAHNVVAQESPIKVHLISEKNVYQSGEPVKLQINVLNDSGTDVITLKGFSTKDFHLMITFTDPDGNTITTRYQAVKDEPGPPYLFEGEEAALIEIFANGKTVTNVINDARAYYDLIKYGTYTAQVFMPVETFSQGFDSDGDGNIDLAYLSDRNFYGYGGAIQSNKVTFDLVSPVAKIASPVHVKVNLVKVGGGKNPSAKKMPLNDVRVLMFKKAALKEYEPINWKAYPLILANDVKPAFSNKTIDGIAKFENIPKDDYLIIAQCGSQSVGDSIAAKNTAWGTGQPLEISLTIMEKAGSEKVPGKTTRVEGSYLLIYSPEFIEWDSSQEIYPFVFESADAWTVTTSVSPPKGFVADSKSEGTDIKNEMKAVQFTITGSGPVWKETEVTYKIKHKGKIITIKDKIGVKLSTQLAQQTGLGIYGETGVPLSFKGGKRVE